MENRIQEKLEKLGYTFLGISYAETGSIYLDVERDGVRVRVRISDHAECYPPRRGVRQISISPDEMSEAEALELLGEGPDAVEPSAGPEPLNESQKAAIARDKARRAEWKKVWRPVRESLTEEDFAEFKRYGYNRLAARRIARRLGIRPTVAWSALTGGKEWNKS